MKIHEIVQRAEELGLVAEDLDDRVHNLMEEDASEKYDFESDEWLGESMRASDINNSGLENQLKFIFFGDSIATEEEPEEVERVLQELLANKS